MFDRCLIAAPITEPARSIVEPIIAELYPALLERIAPHVTLVAPFETEAAVATLRKALSRGCGGLSAFPIRLEEVGHFQERVVYAALAPQEKIATLHWMLLEQIRPLRIGRGSRFEGRFFHPHLTLANQFSGSAFGEKWERAKKLFRRSDCTLETVTLYHWNAPRRVWDTLDTYKLKAAQ